MARRQVTAGLPCGPGRLGLAVTMTLSMLLAGCASSGEGQSLLSGSEGTSEQTSSLTGSATPAGAAAAREYWQNAYTRNPNDEKAVIGFARALKAEGAKEKALSLLQQAAIYNSDSKAIASEEGRLALDMGQTDLAGKLLTRANDPQAPDWRVLNALGAIEAQRGNKAPAKDYFERAARLAPREPSVLNNLALIYALDNDPAKAEEMLRRAAAAGGDVTKVRQNLALVLGVQGKLDEAQQVAEADIGKEQSDANRAYLQKMVAATPMTLGKPGKMAKAGKRLAVPVNAWSTGTLVEPSAAGAWSANVAAAGK